jgi:hypothetical protein
MLLRLAHRQSMPQHPRRPWPLKWIAAAIAIYIAAYTVVNLRYRKPGPEFQPYEQFREREALARAGWRHIPARAEWPADPRFSRTDAEIIPGAGGLPGGLGAALSDQGPLPVEIGRISAAGEAGTGQPYAVQFSCSVADNRCELGGAELYLKDGSLCIVPDIERLPGALLSRTRIKVIRLTVGPGALPAGRYRVTLVAERASKCWALEVK